MGAENSKSTKVPKGHLSETELATVLETYNSINTNQDPKTPCSYDVFKKHCEKTLDKYLAQKVADEISCSVAGKPTERVVTYESFRFHVDVLLVTSGDEKLDAIWNLATGAGIAGQEQASISTKQLVTYIKSVISSYLNACEKIHKVREHWGNIPLYTQESLDKFTAFLLSDLFHPNVSVKLVLSTENPSDDKCFTKEEFQSSITASPVFLKMHDSCLSASWDLNAIKKFENLVPTCLHAQRAFLPDQFSIMDIASVIFLNIHLPTEMRSQWRFLFSTDAHGESFSKFLGQVLNKGASVIIIKDENGRVFGGLGTQSWALGPKFFGGHESFLFHLNPKFLTYSSTGFNENFQYINTQQQTLPNGLGMGGKLEYFGLWIDAEFGTGKSAPSCTTFSCPQLTESENFSIQHMEVWGVGSEPKKEEGVREEKSILDKDPEAQAMLEMIDKGRKSDGYREPPKDED